MWILLFIPIVIVGLIAYFWPLFLTGAIIWLLVVVCRRILASASQAKVAVPAAPDPSPHYLRRWGPPRREAVRHEHGEWEEAYAAFERDVVARQAGGL